MTASLAPPPAPATAPPPAVPHQPGPDENGSPVRGLRWHRWLPAPAVALPILALVHHYGVARSDLALFGAYVALGIAVPGTLLWRAARRRSGSLAEDLAPGLAVGYAVEVVAYLVARAAGAPRLVVVAPAVVLLAFLAVPRLRRYWRTDRGVTGPGAGWLWAMAGIVGALLAWSCVTYLRTRGAVYNFADGDLPFHLALIGEARHHVPPQVPWVAGEPLQYHWYGYLHLAATSWVTGIEPETILLKLYFLPLLAALPLLVASAARRIFGGWWTGVLAAGICLFGVAPELYRWPLFDPYRFPRPGPVDDGTLLREATWISITQTFAAVVCVPLVVVLVDLLRRRDSGWRPWTLVVLLVAVMTGAKATYLPILLCGLLAVVVLGLPAHRRLNLPALAAAGVVLAAAVFSQVVLLKASPNGLLLDPLGSMNLAEVARVTGLYLLPLSGAALAVVTALTVLAWVVVWSGILGALGGRRWGDPAYGLLTGAGIAGMGVVLVFQHYGNGQTWFLIAARPYLSLAAAGGIAALVRSAGADRRVARGLFAGAAAAGAALAVYIVATGRPVTPKVGLDGPEATVEIVAGPYAALLVGLAAAALFLWLAGRRYRTVRRLGLALLAVCALATSAPAAVDAVARDVRVAAADGFRPVELMRSDMPRGARKAGRWLRDHSRPADLVATNGHCRQPTCDSLHFWFTAFAERRFLVEGWGFTAKANEMYGVTGEPPVHTAFWDPVRLNHNDAVFHTPSAAAAGRLREVYGVRWLFVDESDPKLSPAVGRYARLRVRFGDCAIYELR
ncbi:hypothetical protein [Spirilliplanes yamanashiensis]|uniref:Uncharacterized protein n=1 Tax=Spirilliplanes yamanashiensis TaxID=42233 RepID=A0A8J4DL44_9ACTN|nr:hypothetical protein [Spirilliplanes yamanashiensis]MDP9816470.1 hypothetical protein [Spirilliplanes yamanashiensis]GIJ05997.1 hypothetical protein Sya03_53490 [Spirilliplanes yamanashiensis]